MRRLTALCLPIALVLVNVVTVAHAQTFITFDLPSSFSTQPSAINSKGQVTGTFVDATGQHGFLREADGTLTSFDAPQNIRDAVGGPQVQTFPTSMDAAGHVAGYVFSLDTFLDYGFARLKDGTFIIFSDPDACRSQGSKSGFYRALGSSGSFIGRVEGIAATGVNNQGQITGICGPFPPFNESFLRQRDGEMVVFKVPVEGPTITLAQAINCRGQITGYYYDSPDNGSYRGFLREPDGTITTFGAPFAEVHPVAITSGGRITGSADGHGFVRLADGRMRIFDVPDSTSTQPIAMNAKGQVAGTYLDAGNVNHGFVREKDGVITTFDVPGSTSTYPTGINPSGDVTGWYSDASGTHGFVLSQ
jgi:hypothetical protein